LSSVGAQVSALVCRERDIETGSPTFETWTGSADSTGGPRRSWVVNKAPNSNRQSRPKRRDPASGRVPLAALLRFDVRA